MEWLAIGAALLAGALLLQTNTPTILPAEAPNHDGNTVRITGAVVQQRGNWFHIAAGGTTVEAHHDAPPPPGTTVTATGRMDKTTFFVDHWKTEPAQFAPVSLEALATEPERYQYQQLQIVGNAKDAQLEHGGRTLQLSKPLQGPVQVQGTFHYEPDCLCHQLTIHSWASS